MCEWSVHCVGLTFFTKQKYNNLIINEQHVYNTTIESFMHSYYTIYTIIDERAYKSHIFRVHGQRLSQKYLFSSLVRNWNCLDVDVYYYFVYVYTYLMCYGKKFKPSAHGEQREGLKAKDPFYVTCVV